MGSRNPQEQQQQQQQQQQQLTIFYNGRVCVCEVTELQVSIYGSASSLPGLAIFMNSFISIENSDRQNYSLLHELLVFFFIYIYSLCITYLILVEYSFIDSILEPPLLHTSPFTIRVPPY